MADNSITIQFKRASAKRWEELNPVLKAGEPGFIIGDNRLKIGDGVTAWNDLKFIGEEDVINAETHYDFPAIGKEDVIYKAETEQQLYQWNPTELKYEPLDMNNSEVLDIDIINGGKAAMA